MEGSKSRYTCYTVFQRKVHKQVLEENPLASFAEISKKIGEMWSALSVQEKKKYKAEARKLTKQRNAANSLCSLKNKPSTKQPSATKPPFSTKHLPLAKQPSTAKHPSPAPSPPLPPATRQPGETTAAPSALGVPFPVTLIRVDRTPQPMTYQFADKTDMLSMCNVDGAKLNVKVVYTCTPVNPQGKVKTSPIKNETFSKAQSLPSTLNRGCTVPISNVTQRSTTEQPVIIKAEKYSEKDDVIPIQPEPNLSLVKTEVLDDVMVIEDSIPSQSAKLFGTRIKKVEQMKEEMSACERYGSLSIETVSPSEMIASSSSGQVIPRSSPLVSTFPPLLQPVLPLSSAPQQQMNSSPPVLCLEQQLPQNQVSRTPANSITASSILKEKLASFVASNRSFTDVDTMPTKLTIQGKSIVLSASNPQQSMVATMKEADKEKSNLCALTTSSEPPVRVAFRPKRKDEELKKEDGDEVPVYTCNQCMIAFSHDIQLRTHFLSAHTEEKEGSQPQYKCHFCSIVFMQKHDLTAHMVAKHANKGVVSIQEKVPLAVPSGNSGLSTTSVQSHGVKQMYIQHGTKHPEHRVPSAMSSAEDVSPHNRGPSHLTPSAAESCNMCGCVFPYKRSLDIHRLKEHANIFSPTASVSLDRSETVKLEVEGKVGSTVQNVVHKTSFCLSCGYPCKSNSELGKHIYSKHGGKYFCPANGCKRVYQERRCLKLHINSHHPKFKAYSCKSCSFCTYQQLSMLKHLDDHANILKGNVMYVEKHEDILDEDKDIDVDEGYMNGAEEIKSTEEEAETPSAPYVYIERFNGEEVEDVPFNLSPGQSLVAHSEGMKPNKAQKSDPQGFRCLDCNGWFSNKNSLTSHFSSCGSNTSAPVKKKQKLGPPSPVDQPLTCNLCFTKFKTYSALKSHRRNVHFNHNDDNAFSCLTCNRIFPNKRGLVAHMRQHNT